jgi:hypothetical protein
VLTASTAVSKTVSEGSNPSTPAKAKERLTDTHSPSLFFVLFVNRLVCRERIRRSGP